MAYLSALLPKADELERWLTVEDAMAWANVADDMMLKISMELGEETIPDMNVLAAVDVMGFQQVMGNLGITVLKRTRVNLLMNALKQKFGMPLVDYTKEEQPPQVMGKEKEYGLEAIDALLKTSQDKAASGSTVAVAHVLDQTSSEQLQPLPSDQVDALRQGLHEKLDGEPLEAEDFTDAQITAFKKRIDSGGSPACDYAILGPYGNRTERRMKFAATFRDTVGQERTMEVAGPDSIDTWESCHQVFKNLCLACGVSRSSTLDNYKAKFKERCAEFAGQWGLAMAAEATCRMELWPRLKSQHQRLHNQGGANAKALSLFDPAMPWESAINASISDNEFWGKYFERKALKALAAPRPGQPIHAVPDEWQPPTKIAKKQPSKREQAWLSGDGGRRADGRLFWDGKTKFCAEYHLDNGCQQKCPHNLSHRCEFCLGWHRSSNCSQQPAGWTPPTRRGAGKDKGKGKAKGDKGGKKGGGKASYHSW